MDHLSDSLTGREEAGSSYSVEELHYEDMDEIETLGESFKIKKI